MAGSTYDLLLKIGLAGGAVLADTQNRISGLNRMLQETNRKAGMITPQTLSTNPEQIKIAQLRQEKTLLSSYTKTHKGREYEKEYKEKLLQTETDRGRHAQRRDYLKKDLPFTEQLYGKKSPEYKQQKEEIQNAAKMANAEDTRYRRLKEQHELTKVINEENKKRIPEIDKEIAKEQLKIAQKREQNEIAKETASKEKKALLEGNRGIKDKIENEKQVTAQMLSQVATLGIVIRLTQQFVKNIRDAATEVKELRLAEIFSGKKYNGFTQTAFGTDVSVAGNMFLAAQKSPYANEFLRPENMRQLAFFKQMLGQNVEQLVPFITALRNVDEEGMSTNEVMLMLSNAMMKSSFEVGSFTPILAQFIPQMKQAGVSTKEMIGIMSGLSNLGTQGRALGMAMPALGLHLVNPSATGKKWYQQFGIQATEEIKKGGMIGLVQKIKSVYDQIVATQGKDKGLQFLKDISPGREHGALLNIMDNIDYIKQMTNEIGNTSSAQAKQNSTARLTGNLMKEIGANAKNIGTAWWDIVGGSELFKSVLVSIRDILGGIASVMQDINKNPMIKGALSVGTLALTGLGLTKVLGAILPGILKFAGTKIALGMTTMGAGSALPILAGIKAAVLPFLGPIGVIAGAVVVLFTIRDMVNEMRRKRGEADAQGYSDYLRLGAKAQKQGGKLSFADAEAFRKAEELMIKRSSYEGHKSAIKKLEIKITSDGTLSKTAEYNVEQAIRNSISNMANIR
jgi:TP901 family phage tail tape measure protein